ncbi:aminotransferase class I/II-fold pyridoxal phosphate-dependent enzyme [Granulicella sp. 5B5]|uniref:aminotransferase class I/II-fold pyridoxal phosphate-dependent enzyme n=1 Tax=Granulicella sp. 5B5 TaxID=1617967 RepID=UPI0015F36761|nr:aminotransferase class I/II-fold pyridoxal phosphate-dependent enzyme [Granulicella sp. 5B5]QMV17313.1 aminotransferase class I/II-fold pyridoxal phosphate-dependent enzyme [Granulicella sp. 5B5]
MANPEAYPLHGGQLRQIAERFRICVTELLDFSANINPDGPPSSVLSALRTSLDDSSTLMEYPDLQETDLRLALACYAGTNQQNIAVANGFVPLLEATLRALKVRSCLLPVPSFVEYRKILERAGVAVVPHVLSIYTPFHYDPAPMLVGQWDSVLLANPQNPSGVCHDAASIHDVITNASAKNMHVFLDEAFIDYVPEHSLTAMVEEFQNLIIFRSVTKFYGIPGLRVAYTIANPKLASAVNDNLPPWSITTLASRAVIAAVKDETYARCSRSKNAARRTALQANLGSSGLRLYPSAANFVLFSLPAQIDPDAFWEYMIREHRIVLRSCASYEGLAKGHFRAAIRTQSENEKLATAVAKALSYL